MNFKASTSFAALAVLLSVTTFGCSSGGSESAAASSSDETTPTTGPPTAAYSTLPGTGDAPLNVQFTNQSDLGGEVFATYTWIFGDGTVSNDRSPSHTYQLPGIYSVSLFVTTAGGTETETKTDLVTVLPSGPLPLPDFSANPRSDGIPLDVQFSNLSDLGGHTFSVFSWDFGDGETSSDRHPQHRYRDVGLYTVSLTVSTAGGTNTETKADYIEALVFVPPPAAEFSATPQNGKPPLEVQFTNLSSLNGAESATYLWDFGDGQTSTEQHPFHAYSTIAHFTVSLTTTTRGGVDTETKTDFVNTDLLPPVADFSANLRTVPPGIPVDFADQSDLDGALNPSFLWNFGDGLSSTLQHPSHVYAVAGSYTVSLTVTTLAGTDTVTKADFIDVKFPPPMADFSATPTSGTSPLNVQFTNLSNVFGATSSATYLWTFGDGGSSVEENPLHTYMGGGVFTVSLRVTTDGGTDLEDKPDFIQAILGDRSFVLTFPEHRSAIVPPELRLFLLSDVAANGQINIPARGISLPFSLLPGVVGDFSLEAVDAMALGSDMPPQPGIEIISSDPISVYGLNYQIGSADGFVTLPEDALGMKHFVMSVPSHSPNSASALQSSQFAVVAKEDNTFVTITLTENTGSRIAGAPFTILLNRLEVYQLQSDDTGEDLTGTFIDSSKPVALFSGHLCANLPSPDSDSCDYLVAQTPAVNTWGTRFVTVPLTGRKFGDTIRIVAQLDNTFVTFTSNGTTETFGLDRGQVLQRLRDRVSLITATGPIMVNQFANSTGFDTEQPPDPSVLIGDSFMMTIVPLDAGLTAYNFPTPESFLFQNNFINIVVDIADAVNGLVLLDNVPIDPSAFTQVPDEPNFSTASIFIPADLTLTNHSLSAPNPFGLNIYGFHDSNTSYGFSGGMAF